MSRPRPALLVVLVGLAAFAALASTAWLALAHLEARLWTAAIVGLAGLAGTVAVLQDSRRAAATAGLALAAGLVPLSTGIEDTAARAAALVAALAVVVALEGGDLLLRLRETDPPPPADVVAASVRSLLGRLTLLTVLVAALALAPPLLGPAVLPGLAATSVELWSAWGVIAVTATLAGLLLALGAWRRWGSAEPG